RGANRRTIWPLTLSRGDSPPWVPRPSPTRVSRAMFWGRAGRRGSLFGAHGAVLVDFCAEWCGPCRMIAPALEEISNELGDKVTVAKLNIDENPDTPTRYGVRGIPTMLLFKGGQPIAQKVGAAPRSQIQQWIESAIQSAAA